MKTNFCRVASIAALTLALMPEVGESQGAPATPALPEVIFPDEAPILSPEIVIVSPASASRGAAATHEPEIIEHLEVRERPSDGKGDSDVEFTCQSEDPRTWTPRWRAGVLRYDGALCGRHLRTFLDRDLTHNLPIMLRDAGVNSERSDVRIGIFRRELAVPVHPFVNALIEPTSAALFSDPHRIFCTSEDESSLMWNVELWLMRDQTGLQYASVNEYFDGYARCQHHGDETAGRCISGVGRAPQQAVLERIAREIHRGFWNQLDTRAQTASVKGRVVRPVTHCVERDSGA